MSRGSGAAAGGSGKPGGAAPGTASLLPDASAPSAARTSAAALHIPAAERRALAARYLAIANPANHRLDEAVDSYEDDSRDDLGAARSDLRDEVATEHQFDAQLLRITFPALVEAQAEALVRANKRRIKLTERQARAHTLEAMRRYDSQHADADAAVEAPVRRIRVYLGLPPPATS